MTKTTKYLLHSISAGAVIAAIASTPTAAVAETNEVRFAQQFGLLYLPMHVVVDKKMVQACAKEKGLGDVKVTMHRFSGGAAVNQALLSGNVDFAAGGIGPLLKLWDKTKGRLNVKAMTTLSAMPLKLNTNDKRVKKLEDYVGLTDHKISTPSVKVSIQAVVLQMASKKKWGEKEAFKLDPMTVSMKHPSAMAALLAGGQAVKSHFATLPTSFAELQSGKVHNVLTSYDVLGGRHSTVAMYNKEEWKKANPKMYECVWTSYRKAMEWINGNKKDAAALFHRFTKSKLKLEDIEKMVGDENEMLYSLTPERTMEFAKFMHSIGAIKNMPASWKDYYWENNYDQNGG
ncbi:MAG: ABC transporter substrate-binding protein [Hyphomicrobiales bacterium]|nr:ABC transporter substrate-binding protein [Hyphomicrobiales bacterium]